MKYSVSYVCENCNHRFEKKILRGQEAPKRVSCTRCDCLTGYKSWTQEPLLPRPISHRARSRCRGFHHDPVGPTRRVLVGRDLRDQLVRGTSDG